MNERMERDLRKAQSTLEYVVLLAVIAAACVGMQTYARRAIQANFKTLDHTLRVDTELINGATP